MNSSNSTVRNRQGAKQEMYGKENYQNGSIVENNSKDVTLTSRILNKTLIPIFLMGFCPNLVILLWFTATQCNGSLLVLFEKLSSNGYFGGIIDIWRTINIASPLSVSILGGYIVFAVVLQLLVPGPRALGPVTPKGNTPVYKDNGFYCFLITLFVFGVLTGYLKTKGLSPSIVYDIFGDILATVTLFSLVFCVFLYLKGLIAPSTSDCGSSGNPIFDYYWGTELYPRIFGIDVKVFTNCRFGMTVWPLLCLIYSIKSYELHGFVDSIWVSCSLQMIYFLKFFWWEAGYMRTIDIMVDRAGFYICWGCMAYVPGLYASVCMFLVNQPIQLGPVISLTLLTVGSLAIIINYWADQQKQEVRNTNGRCNIWGQKPEVINAKYRLENGEIKESLLLVSGFWGIARHFHYVPELILAFCWSVPSLLYCPLIYAYFIFLTILLVHRTYRDDEKCGKKYGKYWEKYCEKVPYKMIPYLF